MRVHRGLTVLAAVLVLAGISGSTALAVDPVSPPPVVAVDDAYGVDEDVTLTVPAPGVLENDTTLPTGCAAVLDASMLAGGLDFAGDGSFTFIPGPDFNGQTSFTYGLQAAATDPCAGPYEGQATVTITVEPLNDAPSANADSFQYIWGQTLNIAAPGILANDADVDGDGLSAIEVTEPAHGVLTLAANGGFSYTPAPGAACPGRADAFSYRASDGQATSPVRVVLLNPAALPCPTPFVPPTPSPTPAPTPTAVPTVEPSPTAEPSPEESPIPTPSVSPSAVASLPASPGPTSTAAPVPVDDAGGPSLPVLLVLVLLGVLLAFGAAFAAPRLLGSNARGTSEPDDGGGPVGGA